MFKIILIILLCIDFYMAGKMDGKVEVLEKIEKCLNQSKTYDEFYKKILEIKNEL